MELVVITDTRLFHFRWGENKKKKTRLVLVVRLTIKMEMRKIMGKNGLSVNVNC